MRIFTLAVILAAASVSPAAELDRRTFDRLIQQLKPAKNAPWRTIPWRISLLQAQQVAAEQGKPIFIWAMDGHPLGCT